MEAGFYEKSVASGNELLRIRQKNVLETLKE
jgi:hypothetical protein